MKLLKMDQMLPDHNPDTFEIVVELMSGDADSFDPFVLGPFKDDGTDDGIMEEILTLLKRMKDFYPNGRMGGGRNNYDAVPGFTEMFEGVMTDDFEWIAEPKFWPYNKDAWYESWPMDKFDYDTHADPYKVQVYFYDENLNKYEVEVVLD